MGGYCHSHGYHLVGANQTSANCSWKKDGHKDKAKWTNTLGGDTFWPSAKRIAINQQNHATWKGKSAPTNRHGLGTALYTEEDTNSAAFNKIMKKLSSNFYYCLSPPTCQVKEHKPTGTPRSQPTSRNLGATPRTRKKAHQPKQQYIIDIDYEELKEGIAQAPIPTTVANSAATSGIGTINNPCQCTGKPSHKLFILPNGTVIRATQNCRISI